MPEVIEAHLVSGDYDHLVKVVVSDTEHYERFLRESLYKIRGIQHSRSTFALRALKDAVYVDPLLLRQQLVGPALTRRANAKQRSAE